MATPLTSVALPTDIPAMLNSTDPVGVPAPGATAVTVAVIVLDCTETAVVVAALFTTCVTLSDELA